MQKAEIEARRQNSPNLLDRLARAAYGGYAIQTDNKKFDGTPMLTYDEMPPHIRAAWEAAAISAVGCFVALQEKALEMGAKASHCGQDSAEAESGQ